MRAQPPGRWLYLVAAIIAVSGLAVCGLMLYNGVTSISHGFQQFVVPGATTVRFDRPGTYTIYHEYRSVVGNRVFNDEPVSGLECEVREVASGRMIPIRTARASTTYSVGGREGRGLFDVRIDSPGEYRFSARYAPGFEGPQTVLAVGTGSIIRFLILILGGLALLMTAAIVAVLIAIYTYVARSSRLAVTAPDKI